LAKNGWQLIIKNINMKQLLFLLLFPCLAMAQYPGNAGQKITLGEQTTADGLVYRGVENDTALITPLSDTSAYIILDTVNNRFFHYKRNTNVWSVAGGSDTSLIAYVNTYGTQTVNGAKTFSSDVTGARFNPTSSTATGTGMFLPASNTLGFSINNSQKFLISPEGNLSSDSLSKTNITYKTFELGNNVGTTVMAGRTDNFNEFLLGLNFYYDGGTNLEYIGNGFSTFYSQNSGKHIFFTAPSGNAGANITYTQSMTLKSDSELQIAGTTDRGVYNLQVNGTGVWGEGAYVNGSDANIKENIVDLDNSLNIVNNLKPVSFNYINTSVNNDTKHLGFIAQDVYQILENKDYLNSIVRSDGETLSIAYSNLIPLLTKAIQEQQTLIKALEQRILILENK
jgi:hypothetical protein